MVAVIAGGGLGLWGTSLQQLGLSPGGQAQLGQSGTSQYVNLATGNLVLQGRDEDLVAQGFLAGLVRTYNSLGSTGDYGTGSWLLGLDRSLSGLTGTPNTAGSTITRGDGDGAVKLFTYDATRGLYVAATDSGAYDTLQWNAATSTWTYTAGGTRDEETYNASGQLTGLTDAKSGASYTLGYNGGQLASVTASDREALELGYDAQGRVSTLSTLQVPPGGGAAVTQSRVSYAYDSLGRLSSVTTDLTPDNTSDASTFTTTYTYDGTSNRVASLTQSDGLVVSYTYAQDANGAYRIATVTTGSAADGDAQTLSFSYDLADRTTTVTDASGRAWVYGYDANGNLTSVTSPAVNGQLQVTTYTYTTDGHVASVTDALGNTTIYEYDAHGNRTLERDADGHTITWTYNADDQVLSRTVYQVADPDGSDPTNAGQPSDPSTTWYVYDDGSDGLGHTDQLRYVIDTDGDVSETQYNANGQVSLTRSFAGAAYDTSALNPGTAPTLSAMNTWVTSQDLTRTTRVDYAYDPSGRLTGKTAWDEVDSSGQGVADAGESITQYVYDAQGLLRQQVTERGADRTLLETVSYSYDGLGRLIGKTDALGHVTTWAHQAGGTLAVTQANGMLHTEVRNSAGELVTVTESASDGSSTRTTHYLYDEDGQLRATEDPSGAITYTFYDAAGRISGTVDPMGAVTQYTRDADGNVVETRQYATTVDTTSWLTNGAVTASTPTDITVIAPAASPNDRVTFALYDAAGLHVADVDATGTVTTYDYDGAGNLIASTQYATALSAAQFTALAGTPTWSILQGDLASIASAADRTTRTFYDVANLAVATLDAAGYVTTTAYDAAGRIVKTTAYATALTAAQITALGDAPSLSAVLADVTGSANDQVTRDYYDDRGQLVAQIDADGYLTTTAYDETTHIVTTTRYAQALTPAQLQGLTGNETLADLLADFAGSASQTSAQQYDEDGRLLSSTAVDGTVTTYIYDAAGNLTGTTATPPAGGQVRSTGATYDAFGDELTSTDGAGATTTNVYNLLGQKVQVTDAQGNSTWFFYDADDRLAYTVKGIASGTTPNALGEITAYAYDAFGDITQTTRYAGRLNLTTLGLTTSTALSALATAVAAIADPAVDATSTYTYILNGLTASVKDGLGYTTANTYDAFGDLTSVQRQLSGAGQALSAGNSTKTTYTYDARGEQTGKTNDADGLNRSTGVTYDAFGRVTSRTDGNGNVTSYSYDALGRQISVSEIVQGTVRTASTTYDAYNRVVSQTDALNNTTLYQYPDAHMLIVTTPDGVQLTTTKDAYGDTLSVTDSLGNTTRYTYDGDGRRLTTTDALGNVTHDAYDADGDLLTSTDANGVVTAYTYDAAGRVLTRIVDADPGNSTHLNLATTYAYDGRGQQIRVTDPNLVVTTYAYDADGNVLTTVQDDGTGTGNLNLTTTYTWDGAGDQLSITQGAGTSAARTTQYTYDKLGRLTETVVDPGTGHLNLTTSYIYDANDNLVKKTDADRNVTRYVYDEANEQVYAIDAGGGVTQTWRDADGRVTETRRYATALTASQLSALGSTPSAAQVAAQVAAGVADPVTYTVYNDDGQQAYTIVPLGNVTATRHDAAGRVSETLAYANALSASTLASLQASLQQGTALSSIAGAISAAGNTDQNAHATLDLYDADGQVRFVVQQDTVNGQLVGIVSEQRYDASGRVVARIAYGTTLVLGSSESLADQLPTASVQQALAGATNLHLTQYVYDNAGRLRFTIDATNHVVELQYDADGNLTKTLAYLNAITVPGTLKVAAVTTAVNAVNNTASTRYTSSVYDHAGRMLQTSDALGVNATYTYDALGQKTSYENRDGATWTYAYDKAGRLVTQTSPPPQVGGAAVVTNFTYDANGNVLSKTEASGTTVARTTSYTYDSRGNQISVIYPSATYVNAAGQTVTGTPTASVTYDALGRAVVNQDVDGYYEYKVYDTAGELAYDVDGNGYVTAYTYDAYGNQTQVTRYATALTGAGQPLSLAQVQQGLVTSDQDRTLTTTYDQLNRKVQVAQSAIPFVSDAGVPGGGSASPTTSYTYDAYGNVVSTSVLVAPGIPGQYAPTWGTTYDYYDALDQKTLEVDPMGYVTTWAYDAQGNVTSTTQYAEAISTSGLSTTTPPGLPAAGDVASGFNRTTTYTYDSLGRKATETDTGDYSSYVNHAQSIATGSRITSWTYDGEDRVTSVTVNGAKTTTTYDLLGRVLTVTQPARSVLRANWQTALAGSTSLDLSDTTDADLYISASQVTAFTYDALGNVLSSSTSTAGAAGGEQDTYSHYDLLGRVTSETDANGTLYTNTYDAAGNLLSTSYAFEGGTVTTTYTYDADNQRLSTVTKRGSVTDSSTYVNYNAFGEVVAKGDGVVNAYSSTGYELSYQYDNAGNLVSATDAKTGTAHSYSYDLRGDRVVDQWQATGGGTVSDSSVLDLDGRIVSQTTPSSMASTGQSDQAVVYTYDRWGNVLNTTDARGYVTTYEYDSQNHLIKQTEPEVLVTAQNGTRTWQAPTKEWYYDLNGNALGVTDENGNTTLNSYDAAGELTATTDAVGAITRYAYDGLGNQVAKQTPITSTTSHITWSDVDALGRVTAQGDFTPSLDGLTRVPNTQQTYVLDANGNRIHVTDALGNTSYYTYDSQGRLLSSRTPDQVLADVADTYTYDVNGNKTGQTTADKNSSGQFDHETWSYDYYGRVRAHTDLSNASYTYTYDASSGLLTAETSSWNPTTQGQTDPGYVPPSNGIGTSSEAYTYYADGQVAQVTQKTGSTTTTTTTYQYDAAGNTTDENVYTYDGAGDVVATNTTSAWDSHNRLSEVTETESGTGVMRTAYNYDAAGNRRAVFVQSGYDGAPINPGSGGPSVTAIGTQTAQPGQAWSFSVASHFTDTLGFGLTYTATGMPSWMHINSSGVLSTTQAQQTAGSWAVTVTGTDINGNSVSTTFTITVPVVNPVFPGFTPPTASTGVPVSFSVPAATDANGSALSYQATWYNGSAWSATLPSWISFNASTRTWSGTPPAGSAGTWKLAVSAYAANGGSASLIFNLGVSASPPVYHNSLASQTGYGTRAFSYSVPAGAFTEVDGSALTYSAGSYAAGSESALPSWLSFNTSTHAFSGTPPQSVVGHSFSLYVKVTNPSGQTAEGTFTLSVQQDVQPPPVYHNDLTNHSGVLGQAISIPLPSGAFTEPDGGALTYSAQVLIPAHTDTKWNASNTEPIDVQVPDQWVDLTDYAGLSINATNGTITGSPSAISYVTNETSNPEQVVTLTSYAIRITASNAQGGTAVGQFTLSNSYQAPVLQHAIPTPAALNPNPPPWGSDAVKVVPDNTFSNPYGDDTYTATMANGSQPPSGLWLAGQYVTVTSVPAGTYTIKVTATNAGGSVSTTYTLTVNNVAPTISGSMTNLTGVKGAAMGAYTAPAASDLNGDALTYSASNLPPGITFNASTRTFSGTPTGTGTWTVTYKASDIHGASVSKTFTITVSAPAPEPPIYNGGIGTIFFDAGTSNSWTVPSTAFTNPTGRPLSYSITKSDGTALPSIYHFNATTGTLTVTLPGHRGDQTVSVIITATDTTDHLSTHVSTEIYITANLGNNALPAGGGLDAQQTEQVEQTEQATPPNIQSYWFTYDADNRVDVDGGDLVEGSIQIVHRTGSVENEYNQAGEVVAQLSNDGTGNQTQTFRYDARGEQTGSTLTNGLVETRSYDADGRLLVDDYFYASGTQVSLDPTSERPNHMDIGGWLQSATVNSYDADGRLKATSSYGRDNEDWDHDWQQIYNDDTLTVAQEEDPGSTGYGLTRLQSQVQHSDASQASGYDNEGNVTTYRYTNDETGVTTTYTLNYLKQDGYLEASTTGTSSDPSVVKTTDTSLYDAFGRRIAIDTHSANSAIADQVRAFAYDAEGQILQRRDGSATGSTFTVTANGGYSVEHYAYVNGQQVGNVDEHGTINVLGGVTGFSNSEAGTSNYVAQDGDTMQSIAQQVYGDASLWYVVADANGFDAATDAAPAGQTLKLPEVQTNSNTAETFKPYNPHEISGSTTPSLPQAPMPAPSAHGCNTLAAIIVIAVAVVVSVATYGALAPEADSWAGAMLAGAAAGAAGSAASQLAGDALGVSHGFDWGQVLVGAVGGAIGGAVASKLANANAFVRGATEGAASYVGTYETEKLVGEPAHFSWAGLVATAVGSGAAAEIGPTAAERKAGITSDTLPEKIEANLVQDVVTRETSVALGDSHVQSWQQVAEDVFGNALGNAAIAGIEEANARSATKPAQAPIEINPGAPQLQVSDINMPLEPVGPVSYTTQSGDTLSGSLAARQAFIAQVEAKGGPAIDPTTASSSDWADYVSSYSHLGESPAGAQTLSEMVVTPDYSYVKASPAENAYFAAMNRYLDSVSVDQADIARVNAANARQYAADQAQQRALDELDRQNSLALAKFVAIGPLGGALGVAAAASPWVAGALSIYNGYEGSQSIKDGHPIWGAVQIGTGVFGAVGAVPGIARSAADMFDGMAAPSFGSPAAQVGKLGIGAIASSAEESNNLTLLQAAASNQVNSGYAADAWSGTMLKEGTVVYQLSPGASPYFTDLSTAQSAGFDSFALSRALQVKPHDIYGYRPDLTGYVLTQDTFVPTGSAFANPSFGPGGGTQFFIQDQQYLKPITTIDLRSPRTQYLDLTTPISDRRQ